MGLRRFQRRAEQIAGQLDTVCALTVSPVTGATTRPAYRVEPPQKRLPDQIGQTSLSATSAVATTRSSDCRTNTRNEWKRFGSRSRTLPLFYTVYYLRDAAKIFSVAGTF